MDQEQILLDPTSEREPAMRQKQPRPDTLAGLTVGILDISKARGDVFLARLGARLGEQGIAIKHYMKPTFARPAPLALKQQIASECDVVIEGLAD